MKEISIIIPIYNVENYILECIESIVSQLSIDIEVVLVNDGTEDGSIEKIEKYLNENIRIINQENRGLSAARNTGIKEAKGKYLLFVDSDDFIGEKSIQVIKKMIRDEIDIVFLQGINFYGDYQESFGVGFERKYIKKKNKREVIKYLAKLPKFPGSACTKLVRRDILIKNDIFFEEGTTNEDLEWSLKVILSCNSFDFCEIPYYYYRQDREGSITNTFSYEKFMCLFNFIKKWAEIDENSKFYEFRESIYSFLAYEYNILILKYTLLMLEEKKKIVNQVKNYSWLMKYRTDKKNILMKNVFNIFGIGVTSKIVKYYLRVRRR